MEVVGKDEMQRYLEVPGELRDLEYKPPFTWTSKRDKDIYVKEQVIRAILGMTNTKGGGVIVLGVSEDQSVEPKEYQLFGLEQTMLDSFEDKERIKGVVDGFSSEETNFRVLQGQYKENKYVVIKVQEFSLFPAVCIKPGTTDSRNEVLRDGAVYSRTKKAQYGTKEVGPAEMREIAFMCAAKIRDDLSEMELFNPPENFAKSRMEKVLEELLNA